MDGLHAKNTYEFWTDEERALFAKGLEKHGRGKWKAIAEEFVTTKTLKQVQRYATFYVQKLEKGVDPNEKLKRTPWTDEERALFAKGLEKHGRGKWKAIAEDFVTTKTPKQVNSFSKTYFKRLAKKQKAAVSITPDTTVAAKPHPAPFDAQDLAAGNQQISSETRLEVEEVDPMEHDNEDDLAASSGKGVKRSRTVDPEHDSEQVWREKALDLQEKVVLLQSVLDRVTPMVQDLCRIDMNRNRAPLQESLNDDSENPSAFGISDKCQMVENLLEILHTSARPQPADDFAGKDYHEIDQICKLRAFEEALWLLPSFWQESSISELSFVHLEALARDITGDLLDKREDLSYDDPKTGRILSLVSHLTGLVCSCDPFDCNEVTMLADVQQIHSTKESCMAILQTLGRHPAINLYTLQCAVRHLLERTSAALWDNPVPYHLFLEDFYWILHLLEVTLDNESARLCDALAISKWQVVKDVTDNIIQVERILLQGDTQLSHNTLFMTKWKEIMQKLSAYFLFKYGNDEDLRQSLEPEEAFQSEEDDEGSPLTVCDGQRIEVLFEMPMDNPSQFFLGTIRQRADGKFDVQYDDGDIDLDFNFDSPENLYMLVDKNMEGKY